MSSTDARGAREYAADDGFHEIQLSGKQLVFLFMATTVVSVVIFLCGVLVGRGARSEPAPLEAIGTPVAVTDGVTAVPTPDDAAQAGGAAPSGDPGLEATTAMSEGDSSYYGMLNGDEAKAAVVPPPAEPAPESAPAAAAAPASGPASAPASPPAATVAAAPSPRAGWTIQVSAFRDRGQADQFAAQLKARRYDAYVVDPDASSGLFRVRVGSFSERRDATPVADRLKKDKFKPWVTR